MTLGWLSLGVFKMGMDSDGSGRNDELFKKWYGRYLKGSLLKQSRQLEEKRFTLQVAEKDLIHPYEIRTRSPWLALKLECFSSELHFHTDIPIKKETK